MKVYTIIISPKAKKQIDNLPPSIKKRIADILNVIAKNPFMGRALKAELKGLYSYRAGDYRIIYSVLDPSLKDRKVYPLGLKHELIIQVIKVMHRREVYR